MMALSRLAGQRIVPYMKTPLYNSISIDPNCFHFLFIGEVKAHGLNHYVARAIAADRGQPAAAVSLVPDALQRYPCPNVMALNPEAAMQAQTENRDVALRIPMSRFSVYVSTARLVQDLITELLRKQPYIPVWMFESKPELALRMMDRVELIGPRASLAYRCNDKTWQYETLADVAPMLDFRICIGCEELLDVTAAMRPNCPDGVFVSMDYSAGGSESMLTRSQDDVACRFAEPYGRYLASPYVPHAWDPTLLGVVGNAQDVYIAGVADMRIESGNAFRGSTWPSQLPMETQHELREYTRRVGRVLGELGFRGIFGCDFIVDHDGNIFFIEVNPRKQGTTMEFCCALEQMLPAGAPSLPELEYWAVTRDRFPENTAWPDHEWAYRHGLYWGTYNQKVDSECITTVYLPQAMDERELFAQCANHGRAGHIIMEHVGKRVSVKPGTFAGRAAAVGASREEMESELACAIRRLRRSL